MPKYSCILVDKCLYYITVNDVEKKGSDYITVNAVKKVSDSTILGWINGVCLHFGREHPAQESKRTS